MSKKTVQDIVVERLIEKIQQDGRLPWQKPFQGSSMNWFSKHEYTGINKILLTAGEYITVKQMEQYNKSKGTNFWFEKGTPADIVVFYSRIEKTITPTQAQDLTNKGYSSHIYPKDDGTWVRVSWVLRYYRVYNIKYVRDITNPEIKEKFKDGVFEKEEVTLPSGKKGFKLVLKGGEPVLKEGVSEGDITKLEPKLGTQVIETHTTSEEIIEKYRQGTGVKLIHRGNEAYYTPNFDSVCLPPRNQFVSTEAYCRVLFHEFVHSTGIESRLNRSCFKEYHHTKIERSKEELVAEVGSLLLASEAGFREDTELADNSENYVANWCAWMKDNPGEVVSGFFAAEKAKNYILSGGVDTSASSTRNIDNPNQKGEDADVDTDAVASEKSDSKSSKSSSTGSKESKPKENRPSVADLKTKKEMLDYFEKYLAPYFQTSDEKEQKRILDSVKVADIKALYLGITGEKLPTSIRRKADALNHMQQAFAM